jgi:molybdopterin-containing oxidoreductase family membrane subunit
MIENTLHGSKRYWGLMAFWGLLIIGGFAAYTQQMIDGLTVTGMSRDVSWGLYISQFTFLVGVAASAVMVVLPYYLHNYKAFGKMVILGEFLAVSAVLMCQIFVIVDLGQPFRLMNLVKYPTLNSILFWDIVVLSSYLGVNLVIGFVSLNAERKGVAPPGWVKPLIFFSIPLAVSIHTVTAFIFSGLSARTFWATAILAPRFLASAFASGPCLLIILGLILRKFTKFDPGKEAIQKLGTIVAYAMAINLFFVGVEIFTAAYGAIPHHVHAFEYMFFGIDGNAALAPWMWLSAILTVACVVLLLFPSIRKKECYLAAICGAVILAIWIEKGLGIVVTGFTPSPLGNITEYTPTVIEVMISIGVYGVGFCVLTLLYKIVVSVREQATASRMVPATLPDDIDACRDPVSADVN